jgi:hypothetical protein
LAVVSVSALAWRIAGRYAAAIAAVVVVVSPWWFYNGILGNAEPLMVALIAGAVLAHDAGARRTAAVLTFAAALVRPEVWPFALIYGVWLVGRDRRRAVVLVACVVVVVGAWAVPELLHSDATAVGAATGKATSASARYAAFPFLDVFEDAFDQLTVIPGLLAGLGLVAVGVQVVSAERAGGLRRVRASLTLEWAIGLFVVGWIAIVGVMAEIASPATPATLSRRWPGLRSARACSPSGYAVHRSDVDRWSWWWSAERRSLPGSAASTTRQARSQVTRRSPPRCDENSPCGTARGCTGRSTRTAARSRS